MRATSSIDSGLRHCRVTRSSAASSPTGSIAGSLVPHIARMRWLAASTLRCSVGLQRSTSTGPRTPWTAIDSCQSGRPPAYTAHSRPIFADRPKLAHPSDQKWPGRNCVSGSNTGCASANSICDLTSSPSIASLGRFSGCYAAPDRRPLRSPAPARQASHGPSRSACTMPELGRRDRRGYGPAHRSPRCQERRSSPCVRKRTASWRHQLGQD